MRLWVFDRSGVYSSEKLDIKEPEQFVKVIASYALMTDVEPKLRGRGHCSCGPG